MAAGQNRLGEALKNTCPKKHDRVKHELELKEMKKTQGEKIRALVQNNVMRERQVVKGNELRMSKMIESMRIENDRRLKRVANENADMVRQMMCQNDADSEKVMARQRKDESVMRQDSSQVAAPECPVSS